MYCGGSSTTSCPSPRNSRAQWCEAPHASKPIRLGGSLAKNFATAPRPSCARNTAASLSSTPCTWKKFAGNEPTVMSMVEGHFQEGRRLGHQPAGSVHREGRGVVVGVATLIGVRDHRPRPLLFQNFANAVRQRRELLHRLLIDDAEA